MKQPTIQARHLFVRRRQELQRRKKILREFQSILKEFDAGNGEEYHIRKSIITKNLHGVDMMNGAVEIAKMRLSLALMSLVKDRKTIEPLPLLDGNFKTGNALVGYPSMEDLRTDAEGDLEKQAKLQRIEEKMKAVEQAYQRVKLLEQQMEASA